MTQYAAQTTVSPEKSRLEIERTLMRYGADGFMYGRDDIERRSMVQFRCRNRIVKFVLPLPALEDFAKTPTGQKRNANKRQNAYDQAVRQRWRALALAIRAKLEAVESGIVTFDSEFLAHIVLPQGETIGEWMQPQLELAYEKGEQPKLLPAPGGQHG